MLSLNSDCLHLILSYTKDPETLRGTYLTCWRFAEFYENADTGRQIHIDYYNYLTMIIVEDGNYNFSWFVLSINAKIPWRFIEKHLELPWVWSNMHYREDLSWEFVDKNSQLNWNIRSLSKREDFPMNLVDKYSGDVVIDWYRLSNNTRFPLEFVEKHSLLLKSYDVAMRDDLTLEFLERNWERMSFYGLSENPIITWEFIESHPSNYWNMVYLYARNIIPDEWIEKNKYNPKIIKIKSRFATYKEIYENPDYPWNWSEVSIGRN